MSQKIRITLKANDHHLVDRSTERIIKAIKPTGAEIKGPIPFPTKKEVYTVLRSPHVNKKSCEKFQLLTHKRLIDIYIPSGGRNHDVLDELMKIELQAGVEVDIKG